MRDRILCGVLAAVISACATAPTFLTWSRPASTYQQYLEDRYACLRDARTTQTTGYVIDGTGSMRTEQTTDIPLFITCMGSKGWMRDPNGFAPPQE